MSNWRNNQPFRIVFLFILAALAAIFVISKHRSPLPTKINESVEHFKQLDYQSQLDLVKKSAESDPVATWQFVKDAFLINGQQVGNAHEFAHLVGNAMYVKFGLDGITNCDQTFAFGCYHGVTEKLLVDQGPSAIIKIQNRCTEIFPPSKSQNFTGCIHGMGHGLFTYEHFSVSKALQDCDGLDNLYKTYCYDGVFMEHSTELTKGEFNPAHPWQFCTSLDSRYHYNCARYQSQIFLGQFGGDISTVSKNCSATTDEILVSTCFESLGYYITQQNLGKLSSILDACSKISGEGKYHCIIGSTREVKFQAYPNWQTTTVALCNSLPETWKNTCINNQQPISPM